MALVHSLDGIRPNKLENLQCPVAHLFFSKEPNISLGLPPIAGRESQLGVCSRVKHGSGCVVMDPEGCEAVIDDIQHHERKGLLNT